MADTYNIQQTDSDVAADSMAITIELLRESAYKCTIIFTNMDCGFIFLVLLLIILPFKSSSRLYHY